MEIEEERGGQYDPAEVAIVEQQGPVELAHEAAIRAVVENASQPTTHPLRRGRIRLTAFEISQTTDQEGATRTDWSLFKSVSGMDAGGE